jgi:hypothetical protein
VTTLLFGELQLFSSIPLHNANKEHSLLGPHLLISRNSVEIGIMPLSKAANMVIILVVCHILRDINDFYYI